VHSADTKTTNIVIAALGGEGGGTLVAWIEEVAYNAGWYAQATSIAGVAQRTGATIYYIELFPGRDINESGSGNSSRAPIMSMFPAPGDIDIAISSEIAEAGRLIQRGFCSKDRTTLIASNHHVFGITEKVVLSDGRTNTELISKVASQQCKNLVSYDMRELADQHNTVISATLFGALAGSKALPFSKTDYQAVISASGKMVENNLAAFNASYNKAIAPNIIVEAADTNTAQKIQADPKLQEAAFTLPKATTQTGAALLSRIENSFPTRCHEFITFGIEKLLDYQDSDYANQYLDELDAILQLDSKESDHQLTKEAARHLALWMCFEDTARVAQIKTRAARQSKIKTEVGAADDQIYHLTEFFAPRLEELCQPLPARVARWVLASPTCRKLAAPFTKGKRLRTDTIVSFSVLRMMALTRKWRRSQYSYQHEHEQINSWLKQIKHYAADDRQAALEITKAARVVKGYGKTRERGSSQIEQILQACQNHKLKPEQISKLTKGALEDDAGETFNQTISALSN